MIGGTDISAILGMNRYKSPFDVYLKCIGEGVETPDNPSMKWGRELEPVVADEYQRNHPEIEVVAHDVVTHPYYKYVKGSPDRVGKRKKEIVKGIEIKTGSIYTLHEWGEPGTSDVPISYKLQCGWYSGLFHGIDWDLAALIGGSDYREYKIPFDAELWNLMLEAAAKFWQDHVEKRNPPEMTATDATAEYIKRKFARATKPMLQADDQLDSLCREYADISAKIAECESRKDDLKVLIQGRLGEAEGCQFSNGKITWKEVHYKGKCNWESLAAHMGATEEQIARFMGEGKTVRTLKIYNKKG